jgi:tetratricopeptide (TPR) repeat protein
MDMKSIDRVFWDAAQIADPAERAAYLDRTCAGDDELRRRVDQLLLARSAAESFLESPLAQLPATSPAPPAGVLPNTQLGRYKLLEQIGEGGFGVVFMAEQHEPVRRKVALKVIKPGMDSRDVIARFEAERQALALMDHPNIATILDAGQTASGSPYFVMELVKGIPITEFCDQAGLTIRERLDLFVVTCRAVQHAHQKGVIHRDLKPSNVLVTLHDGAPVVKVIDFGVAKALGQPLTDKTLFTGFAQLIGTPLYMSPEQAALSGLDVDTRSDVYALGVLLFELLTGTTPFSGERLKGLGFDEIRRIIREEEPARPSTRLSTLGQAATVISANRRSDPKRLRRVLRGDLDWIVLKALEKDRNRRYETAIGLARDIESYLCDEHVQACPPSAWYRLRKFARRNKTRLAAVGLLLLAALSLGGGALWVLLDRAVQLAQAEQAATRGLEEAATLQRQARWLEALQAVRRAQVHLVGGEDDPLCRRARELTKDLGMALLLDELLFPNLAAPAGGDRGAADSTIARAFREYGIDVEALEADEVGKRVSERTIRRELVIGLEHWVKIRAGMRRGADDPLRRRLLAAARIADPDSWRNRLRDALEDGHAESLTKLAAATNLDDLSLPSLSLLGWALDFAGASGQAVAVLRQAVHTYPDDFGINFQLAWALEHQPAPQAKQAQDEVIRFYTVARALRTQNVPVHQWLGHALGRRGKLVEAAAVFRRAVELNPDEVLHHYWHAAAQLGAGDHAGYRRTCAAVLDKFSGTDLPEVAQAVAWTCAIAKDGGTDPKRALRLAEAAHRSDPASPWYAHTLGAALYRAGQYAEAARCLQEASDAAGHTAKGAPYSPAYTWYLLALANQRLGRVDVARTWLARAVVWTEKATRSPGLPWNRRLTLQLLRTEAEALVHGRNDGAPPQKTP